MTVAHVIVSLGSGGAQTVLTRLCTSDRENRHVVIALTDDQTATSRGHIAALEAAGVTVQNLALPRGRLRFAALQTLWQMLREVRPDVLQTWLYHADLVGGLVGRAAGVPAVCWGVRSGELLWTPGQRLTIVLRRVCALLSWVVPDAVICNSQAGAEVHRRLGYKPSVVTVIPNGVDTEAFRPDARARAAARASWGLDSESATAGAVGRSDPYKDYPTFLRAMGELVRKGHAWQAVLIGDGVARSAELEEMIRELSLEGTVRRFEPRSDVQVALNGLDVLVVSSAAEAFPNVLIEAMASGVPCITTAVGDAARIVGDTGWVVPPRDPAALASAMAAAREEYRDAAQWQQRRAACRARVVDQFRFADMLDRHRSAWREALSGSGRGASAGRRVK